MSGRKIGAGKVGKVGKVKKQTFCNFSPAGKTFKTTLPNLTYLTSLNIPYRKMPSRHRILGFELYDAYNIDKR